MRYGLRHGLTIVPIAVALSVFMVSLVMIVAASPKTSAATEVCNTAIVLDRSGSVDEEQLETMRQQITRLFEPGGIYDDRFRLAFWSFSASANASINYNAPFSNIQNPDMPFGYASSKGVDSGFQTNLYRLVSGGGTNYEQGLGYDGHVFDSQTMNTRDGIDRIIKQAHIIVLMTDGQPNTPGGGGDNNPVARAAARAAVLKHKAAGRLIVGGIIDGMNQRSLNYAINGNDNDSTNIFGFSTDYSTLTQQLTTIINQKCNELIVDPADQYSLVPTVTTANTVVSGTDGASFSYNVNNIAQRGESKPTEWSVKRILVDRGQSVQPLYFGNSAFRDNYSCDQMLALINGNGSCVDVVSGERTFSSNPSNTSLDDEATGATNVVLDDTWPVGTKVCYVLVLSRPTHGIVPTDRYSRASCLTIGKRPMVQIHGGDLKVGRHFITDGSVEFDPQNPVDPARVVTSITPKSDGKVYGSWGEYGVFSPGLVVGFASMAGLEGGYESTLPNTQEFWSRLTFANVDNEYGLFTAYDTGGGTIPNYSSAILAGHNVARNLTGVDSIDLNGANLQNGLYQKASGNLSIDTSTLQRNKSVIVHVPDGTVRITGNITYSNGPYTSINQIPQLVIIAKRITIDPSVTHVSAWLIGDSADDGTIVTCNDPDTLTTQVCNQQLRIDGPVIARHLSLRRTAGAGTPEIDGCSPSSPASCPAEIINLPIDAYLWSQSEGRSDSRVQTTFTTELPPYF